MNWRFLLAPVAVAASIAALPTGANAGTNIGATCEGPGETTTTLLQYAVGPDVPSYTVPTGGGILTRWAVRRGPAATPNPTKLKLFRANGGTSFTAVAEDQQTAGPDLNEFATRIPVAGGEQLGIFGASGKTPYCVSAISASNRAVGVTPAGDAPLNSPVTVTLPGPPSTVVDVAAYIEPDADGDGFGDESQDACPINASTQGACPVADVAGPSIDTKAFKLSKLLKKARSRIEMTFGSNEAATITIDGTLSVPGGASKTFKLKPVSGSVAAGGKLKLELKVPKKGLRALRRKEKATAVINVVAKDATGNQSTGKFTSKLKVVKTKRIVRR